MNKVGSVVRENGEYDADGNELVAPVIDDRFHVNAPKEIPEFADYKIPAPNKPYRVYAAPATTHFYRFADEEEFISVATAAGLIQETDDEPE